MVRINRDIEIPDRELVFTYTTSQGPGGQNVNKVSTRAVLSFDLDGSPSLDERQKELIRERLSGRISRRGIVRISAQDGRTREGNRRAALGRFAALLKDAFRPVKKRRRTRVPARTIESRLKAKKHRGRIKDNRRRPDPGE
ncbi:MAG TPA: alternative ribosome rescue aminoacyl-tRNA hydrolase ArfB, partial [Candidatus Krumholzibacterium sp.]|nr:alternative ribosome rescue aminoacyl-tRNA hydrolase ArfB [Candidatus Krumholzibacterium sp.]